MRQCEVCGNYCGGDICQRCEYVAERRASLQVCPLCLQPFDGLGVCPVCETRGGLYEDWRSDCG